MPADATMTPWVETLPFDILARVFLLLKGDQDRDNIDQSSSTSSHPVPEVCSQVSGYFREVARGCALLWTTVTIEEGTSFARVKTYCSLSGSAPLAIRVMLGKGWRSRPQHVDHVFNLLAVLMDNDHRWQSLSIHLGIESTVDRSVVAYLSTSPAPRLETLTLDIGEVDLVDSTVAFANPAVPTIFEQGADNIRALRLRGLAIHIFRPPLQNVTILHLDGTAPLAIAFAAFRDMVAAPQHLKHLSVYGDSVEGWPSTAAHHPLNLIPLPYLESLRIHSVDEWAFEGILLNIDAPSLRSLTLKDMQEADLVGYDLRRGPDPVSFPQVKELALLNFDLPEVGYSTIGRMFPSTEIFRIAHTTLSESKAHIALSTSRESIHGPLGSTTIWPCLHTLHIGLDTSEETWMIGELLEDRKGAGCPLPKLEFTHLNKDQAALTLEEWVANATDGKNFDVDVTTKGVGQMGWPFESVIDPDDGLFV